MRKLLLLGGALCALLTASCVNYETVPGTAGDHCHADLNFAYCHVFVQSDDGRKHEVVVTGTTLLSGITAVEGQVVGGVAAKAAVTR